MGPCRHNRPEGAWCEACSATRRGEKTAEVMILTALNKLLDGLLKLWHASHSLLMLFLDECLGP